jgi:hypothetical protein
MKEITLAAYKREKQELEHNISELIRHFNHKTEVKIRKCSINYLDPTGLSETGLFKHKNGGAIQIKLSTQSL